MQKHCLILTRNTVEAEDLGEIALDHYDMCVHKFRDAKAAGNEVGKLGGVSLAFLSVEYEAHEMAEMVQTVLKSGANVILIDGTSDKIHGPIGLLRRPYSTDDVSRIMADFA